VDGDGRPSYRPRVGRVADIGVIGGSGFYAFLEDVREVEVMTPWGPPSEAVAVGVVAGREVAFLPRHGRDHRFPPHRIPYRANLWALRSLGVRQVLAPCAVGGLQPHLGPGSLVVPDQLVDRTSGRTHTFYDEGTVHVPFADPYCPAGRAAVLDTARAHGWEPEARGTCVVVEGPRFGTRAESEWHARQGWSVVNMTQHPAAVLARELALCYTAIALVTDLDAGVEGAGGVTMEEVLRVFGANTDRLRALLHDVVAALPQDRECPCGSSLDGLDLPLELP
jgi:5'-methylthioadenosine phosphorylase